MLRPSLPVLLALLAGLSPAQGTATSPALLAINRLDAAARLRAQDGGKAWQEALTELGKVQDDAATQRLRQELRVAGFGSDATLVLRAIGLRDGRATLMSELVAVLLDSRSSDLMRREAAVAIGRQGRDGQDRLLRLCEAADSPAKAPARDACIDGLAAAKEPPLRFLAGQITRGADDHRLRVLQLLDRNQVRGADDADLTNARLDAFSRSNLQLATTALRQLLVHRVVIGRNAVAMVEELLQRFGTALPGDIRVQLMAAVADLGDTSAYPLLLQISTADDHRVQAAIQGAAMRAFARPDFLPFLCQQPLANADPAQQQTALRYLRFWLGSGGEAQRPGRQQQVQALLAPARERLRGITPDQLDFAIGLDELFAGDASWRQELLGMARSNDRRLRTAGLSMLYDLGLGDGLAEAQRSVAAADRPLREDVDIAQRSVANRAWELRAMAYRYLRRFRDLSSVPLLIARVEEEDGRLADDLAETLFAHTGRRFARRAEWQAFWQKEREGFVLPPLAPPTAPAARTGNTVAYYGIPLVSKRVAFLVDTSGSMQARIGNDGRSRLDEARRQLETAIAGMGEDHECNVIPFDTTVRPLYEHLQRVKDGFKSEVARRLQTLRAFGGTNVWEALRRAYDDPAVDTIYLLTDGAVAATDAIAADIRARNRTRQVVIHCIGIGAPPKGQRSLLERLAAESGGTYVTR